MSASDEAKAITIEGATSAKRLTLDSGRQIVIRQDEPEEILEVRSTEGEAVLRVRLTDEGPVICLEGTRLQLRSSETLSLTARRVSIRSEEEMEIRSKDDIRVVGKTIFLN